MNKETLVTYLEAMDRAIDKPATLVVYGSAALILLDEPDRTSLDIDVAGPYSNADLAAPSPDSELLLWRGANLTIKTLRPAHLIASKLIRYDEIDRSDIRFLLAQGNIPFADIARAADSLPEPFRSDAVVRENLANLKADMGIWGVSI